MMIIHYVSLNNNTFKKHAISMLRNKEKFNVYICTITN